MILFAKSEVKKKKDKLKKIIYNQYLKVYSITGANLLNFLLAECLVFYLISEIIWKQHTSILSISQMYLLVNTALITRNSKK